MRRKCSYRSFGPPFSDRLVKNRRVDGAVGGLQVTESAIALGPVQYGFTNTMQVPFSYDGARQAINENIQNHEQAAQRAQGGTPEHAGQINNGAMNEFGQALHTVEDRTSPAHTDGNGNPREWSGVPSTPGEYQAAKQHEAEESTISPEQMNNSVQAARDAFGQTFGQNALNEAAPPPPPDKKKEEPK